MLTLVVTNSVKGVSNGACSAVQLRVQLQSCLSSCFKNILSECFPK